MSDRLDVHGNPMKDNTISISVYMKWWHGLTRHKTVLHYFPHRNDIAAFDCKTRKWFNP